MIEKSLQIDSFNFTNNFTKTCNGFSLLELLIVLGIAGILAAIAYPSYTHYILGGRRHAAEMLLVTAANRLEDYHAVNGTYANADWEALGVNPKTEDGSYQLAFENLSDQTYLLTAIPQDSQSQDSCKTLMLNEIGEKTATGSQNDCW